MFFTTAPDWNIFTSVTDSMDQLINNNPSTSSDISIFSENESESARDKVRSSSRCSSYTSIYDINNNHWTEQFDSSLSSSPENGSLFDTDDDECFLSDDFDSVFYPKTSYLPAFELDDMELDLFDSFDPYSTKTLPSIQLEVVSALNSQNSKLCAEENSSNILKAILEEKNKFNNKEIAWVKSEPISDESSNINPVMSNSELVQTCSPDVDQPDMSVFPVREEVVKTEATTAERIDKRSRRSSQKVKRKKRKYVKRASARKNIQLYQFMLRLLDEEDDCITWVSREDGIFRLLKSKTVANMWGRYKKNENMTYESLSRALRHYYSQDILVPVAKKLHYKFCKKTLEDWYKTAKDSNNNI